MAAVELWKVDRDLDYNLPCATSPFCRDETLECKKGHGEFSNRLATPDVFKRAWRSAANIPATNRQSQRDLRAHPYNDARRRWMASQRATQIGRPVVEHAGVADYLRVIGHALFFRTTVNGL
jgi:hypothetical protein